MTVTTWNIDPAHTDIQFSAKHMMVTTVRGKFTAVEGSITLDEENPANSTGSVHRRRRLAQHAASSSATATSAPPTSSTSTTTRPTTFIATTVEPKGGSDYRVSGDLTIRDTTTPVSFDVEMLGIYHGMDGARRAGLHATGRRSTARTSG